MRSRQTYTSFHPRYTVTLKTSRNTTKSGEKEYIAKKKEPTTHLPSTSPRLNRRTSKEKVREQPTPIPMFSPPIFSVSVYTPIHLCILLHSSTLHLSSGGPFPGPLYHPLLTGLTCPGSVVRLTRPLGDLAHRTSLTKDIYPLKSVDPSMDRLPKVQKAHFHHPHPVQIPQTQKGYRSVETQRSCTTPFSL